MSEKLTIEERKRIIDEIINDMLDLRHKQDVNPACEFASISEKKWIFLVQLVLRQ